MIDEQPRNTRAHIVIALIAAFVVYNVIWLGFWIAISDLPIGGPARAMSPAQNRHALLFLCETILPVSVVISIVHLLVNAGIKLQPRQQTHPMWLTMAWAGVVIFIGLNCLMIPLVWFGHSFFTSARLGIKVSSFVCLSELILILLPCVAGMLSGVTYEWIMNRPFGRSSN